MKIEGTGVTSGKEVGEVYWYRPEEIQVREKSEKKTREETERFEAAIEDAEKQLEEEEEKAEGKVGEDEAGIFEAQIQFLKDPQIEENITDNIEEGLTAEKAVQKGFEDPVEQLESTEGRNAERADDLRDVRDRLVRILTGNEKEGLSDIPENSVLVTERLTPSDTTDLDESHVEGIVTAEGSKTSHAAILSRSLGVSAVVGVGDQIQEIEEGEKVLVDGEKGEIVTDPSEERMEEADNSQKAEVIPEKVSTQDGGEVRVAANVANSEEVSKAEAQGPDGIGLYRTEFMFLDREEPPTEEEHYEKYVEAVESFDKGRVIIRTLDIGGDKNVPYLDVEKGENPFLGPRGIRLALEEEELFETQLKALLRAAAEGNLAVMFPLVVSLEEFREAREKVEELKEELDEEGKEYGDPDIGVMIETPAAVEIADVLAEEADFFSIGTNDLTQYTMAASRNDNRVSGLQDPLYPPVIRSIKKTVAKGHENDTWIGMCGEMAGDPELTELLLGLGLDELSMSASLVPRVKENITEIDISEAEETVEEVLNASTREEVLGILHQD